MALTRGDILGIYKRYEAGEDGPTLAALYNTSAATVSRIIRGQVWKEVTGGKNISRRDQLTQYRIDYIQARWDQGCRSQAILADELELSRQYVCKLMRTHKLGKAAV